MTTMTDGGGEDWRQRANDDTKGGLLTAREEGRKRTRERRRGRAFFNF